MSAIEFMWAGGNTQRFHTTPTVRVDTVGHHSFNVACIVMHLRPEASVALLKAALLHDIAEHRTGDMPAPAKRWLPDYPGGTFREVYGKMEDHLTREAGIVVPTLDEEELWILKLADALDGFRFCIQERRMGNQLIDEAAGNFRDYVATLLFGDPAPHPLGQSETTLKDPARFSDYQLYRHLVGEWYDLCK